MIGIYALAPPFSLGQSAAQDFTGIAVQIRQSRPGPKDPGRFVLGTFRCLLRQTLPCQAHMA